MHRPPQLSSVQVWDSVRNRLPTGRAIGDELSAAYTTTAKCLSELPFGRPAEQSAREIAKVRYPGVDLSYLRPRQQKR
jgi:hypothetical protein